ncbi:MAG TPA: hypothetical protein VIG32_09010 [Candidatus Baltobacteraceae bacterium]|jgi:hypothetical protein
MHLSPETVDHFFASIVWIALIVIVIAAYIGTRGSGAGKAPIGRTYACANCGRRGNHEHMVPVNAGGSVVWYCAKHSGSH